MNLYSAASKMRARAQIFARANWGKFFVQIGGLDFYQCTLPCELSMVAISPRVPAVTISVVQKAGRQGIRNALSWMASQNSETTMPGRKPLPTAVKKIKGTLQLCRTNRNEPRSNTTLGRAPEYMSESAKEAWHYAVTNAPAGLLSAVDGAVLERWANCSGMYREALSKINRAGVSGMIIKTPSGILRRSPLMDVIRDLALEMKGYEAEMGFTPAARSRVSVQPPTGTGHDPWDDIAG